MILADHPSRSWPVIRLIFFSGISVISVGDQKASFLEIQANRSRINWGLVRYKPCCDRCPMEYLVELQESDEDLGTHILAHAKL